MITLPRTLEPEAMDSLEEACSYDAMDHGAVNQAFVADFLSIWHQGNPILDVGTGTALIPIELCRRTPAAQVMAIDLAEHMLRIGRENVRQAGFEGRIDLQHGNARKLAFADGTFAAVISNSIVHHIGQPEEVLAEMIRVLVRGGVLFVRDLLRPLAETDVQRLVTTYAGNATTHQKQMLANSLRAALNLLEIRELVDKLGFDLATARQTSDRHWTWAMPSV